MDGEAGLAETVGGPLRGAADIGGERGIGGNGGNAEPIAEAVDGGLAVGVEMF